MSLSFALTTESVRTAHGLECIDAVHKNVMFSTMCFARLGHAELPRHKVTFLLKHSSNVGQMPS